jgi:hypothetical protein
MGLSYCSVGAAIDWWDWFALHLWLLTSSYGIIFAVLSFLEEVSFDRNKTKSAKKSLFNGALRFYCPKHCGNHNRQTETETC